VGGAPYAVRSYETEGFLVRQYLMPHVGNATSAGADLSDLLAGLPSASEAFRIEVLLSGGRYQYSSSNGVTLPDYVSLRGAGKLATVLDFNGAGNLRPGDKSRVSDLTIEMGNGTAVRIPSGSFATEVVLERVRIEHSHLSGGMRTVLVEDDGGFAMRDCEVIASTSDADGNHYAVVFDTAGAFFGGTFELRNVTIEVSADLSGGGNLHGLSYTASASARLLVEDSRIRVEDQASSSEVVGVFFGPSDGFGAAEGALRRSLVEAYGGASRSAVRKQILGGSPVYELQLTANLLEPGVSGTSAFCGGGNFDANFDPVTTDISSTCPP